jgi:hypothetical protein
MHKFITAALLFLLLADCLNAQQTADRKNYLILDLLGPGGFGSVGYARAAPRLSTQKFKGTLGVSASYWPADFDGPVNFFAIMPEFGMVFFPQKKHHLELGLIPKFTFHHSQAWRKLLSIGEPFFWPNYRVGWRIEKPEGKSIFRLGISSLSFSQYDSGLIFSPLWLYVGGGIRF